jgi:hypothetical protein
MGGGDYKERERVSSHCHFRAGDLVQSCPPNLTRICIWSFNHRGNRHSSSGPIIPLTSLLHCSPSNPPRLPCHSFPPLQAGFSPFPVPDNSYYRPLPLPPTIPPPPSAAISRSLGNPNGTDPCHRNPFLAGEPNRSCSLAPCFPRRQRSPPLDLRSRLNQGLSHLFFL